MTALGRSSGLQELGTGLISVAIIEDQPDIREGLAVLIGGTPGYRVLATFGSMEEALPSGLRSPGNSRLLCDKCSWSAQVDNASMDYPKDFPAPARAAVEAEQLRAAKGLRKEQRAPTALS